MAIVDPRAAKLVTGRHWIEDDGAARLEATEKGIVERRGDCYEFRGAEKDSPAKSSICEIQQNRALHRSTTEALRHAADVELYSSTALYISTALQRSTLYILYTLPQPPSRRRRLGSSARDKVFARLPWDPVLRDSVRFRARGCTFT